MPTKEQQMVATTASPATAARQRWARLYLGGSRSQTRASPRSYRPRPAHKVNLERLRTPFVLMAARGLMGRRRPRLRPSRTRARRGAPAPLVPGCTAAAVVVPGRAGIYGAATTAVQRAQLGRPPFVAHAGRRLQPNPCIQKR